MNKQHLLSFSTSDIALSEKPNTAPTLQSPERVKVPTQLRLHSAELFSTAREVVIEHAGEEYRLRLTRQGKLILTK